MTPNQVAPGKLSANPGGQLKGVSGTVQAINAPRYPNATQQVGNPAREPLAATQIAKLRSPELAVHRRRTAAHHSLGPGGGSERATGSPLGAQPRGAEEGVEAEPPRPAAGARGVFSRCATAGRCRGDRSAAVATAPSIPPAGPGRPAATRHGGWGEGTSLLLLIVITIKVCRTLGRDESAGAKAPVTTGGWERAPQGCPQPRSSAEEGTRPGRASRRPSPRPAAPGTRSRSTLGQMCRGVEVLPLPPAPPAPYLRGSARGAAGAPPPRAGMTLRRNSSSGQENKPFLRVRGGGRAGGGRRAAPGCPPRCEGRETQPERAERRHRRREQPRAPEPNRARQAAAPPGRSELRLRAGVRRGEAGSRAGQRSPPRPPAERGSPGLLLCRRR